MNFDEARQRIALAGRELGGGPFQAARRIVPGVQIELVNEARTRWEEMPERVKRKATFDEGQARSRAMSVTYGLAVGLVMAEQPEALRTLETIHQEWETQTR